MLIPHCAVRGKSQRAQRRGISTETTRWAGRGAGIFVRMAPRQRSQPAGTSTLCWQMMGMPTGMSALLDVARFVGPMCAPSCRSRFSTCRAYAARFWSAPVLWRFQRLRHYPLPRTLPTGPCHDAAGEERIAYSKSVMPALYSGHLASGIGLSSSLAGSMTTCLMRLRCHVYVTCISPSLVCMTAG